jgi:hypothetical protein
VDAAIDRVAAGVVVVAVSGTKAVVAAVAVFR